MPYTHLHRVSLYKPMIDGSLQCWQCQRNCQIKVNKAGYCRTVKNIDGVLYSSIYGLISSAAADPIEKKPLYHFKPGTRCFSVGSLGCNFRCDFCQNWQIAYADPDTQPEERLTYMSPEDLVYNAMLSDCDGVAWTYNEPSIWYDYTHDCAKLCKEKGLYTVYVTNGYATEEHLDGIGPYLDAYRVDIKSMEDRFYNKMASVPSVDGILSVAERAKHKWNMHVECVTNVIPNENDSDECLTAIAEWIAGNLGNDTPWHITRFFPHSKLNDLPATPVSTLQRALTIARNSGLLFVYLGNIDLPGASDTICPECGATLIQRHGYQTKVTNIDKNGNCVFDGTSANVRF